MLKITVIGAGSTYTPELVVGFLTRLTSLPLTELCLMDIDPQRLEIVGGFAQRIAQAHGSPFRVVLSQDLRQAIAGASYVITQFRVGMMAARRADEYLGQRHGLIGQETTGVGGIAKALRTIPVVLHIAATLAEVAPNALLLNFTNPSGLVTEALTRYAPDVTAVGVCNSGITAKMQFLGLYQRIAGRTVDPDSVQLDTLGLNHLTWHRGLFVAGEQVWPQFFAAYLDELKAQA
ncbi:MAG: 6-phospho-beta-glucosidase, partial [Anaerolineae bacterium]